MGDEGRKSPIEVDLTAVADMSYKPSLFQVHNILEQEIVGEHKSRMAILTCWILGEKPVFVSGPRASGKTHVSDRIANLVRGDVYELGSGSEKSGWYQMEEINKSKYILIKEINQIPKEAREALKLWGEEKAATYNVTVKDAVTGRSVTEKKVLKPRPYCFCLADEDEAKLDEQEYSRIILVRMDSSIEQNKAVLNRQARLAKGEKDIIKGVHIPKGEIENISNHLNNMPPLAKYSFIHPAAEVFVEAIPTIFTDSRRDFPKLLANTSGITRFYWKERMRVDDKFFITPQDMWMNHFILSDILIESALKCSSTEREILNVLGTDDYAIAEMVQRTLSRRGFTVGSRMIKKHLTAMHDLGYVEKSEHSGMSTSYRASDMYKNFTVNLDWNRVLDATEKFMMESYPEYSGEYFERYLKEPIVIHPFTGEMINMRTMGKESKQYGTKRRNADVIKNSSQTLQITEEVV